MICESYPFLCQEWFYFLLGLVIAAIIFFSLRIRRTNKIKEQNRLATLPTNKERLRAIYPFLFESNIEVVSVTTYTGYPKSYVHTINPDDQEIIILRVGSEKVHYYKDQDPFTSPRCDIVFSDIFLDEHAEVLDMNNLGYYGVARVNVHCNESKLSDFMRLTPLD